MSVEAQAFNEHAPAHGLSVAFGGVSPVLSITICAFILVLAIASLVAVVYAVRRIIRMTSQAKNCRRSTMVCPYILPEFDHPSKEVETCLDGIRSSGDVEAQNIKNSQAAQGNGSQTPSSISSPVHDAYMKLIGKSDTVNPPPPGIKQRAQLSLISISEQRTPVGSEAECPPGCFCHAYERTTRDDRGWWWTSPIMIPETPTLENPRSSICTRSSTFDEASHFAHGSPRSETIRDAYTSGNRIRRCSGATGGYVANRDYQFPNMSVLASVGSASRNSLPLLVPPANLPPPLSIRLAAPSQHCSESRSRPLTWHAGFSSNAVSDSVKSHLIMVHMAVPPSPRMSSSVNGNTEDAHTPSTVEKLLNMSRQEYHNVEVAKWREALKASEEAVAQTLETSWGDRVHETVHIAQPKPVYTNSHKPNALPRRVLGDITNRRAVRITVPVIRPLVSNATNATIRDGDRRISS